MINKTIEFINGSFTSVDINDTFIGYDKVCIDGLGNIDYQCLTSSICNQIDSYVLSWGLRIVIGYILISWFNWWFFNYGYKVLKISYFDDLNKRIYWDNFIKSKFQKVCIGYIVVLLYSFYF